MFTLHSWQCFCLNGFNIFPQKRAFSSTEKKKILNLKNVSTEPQKFLTSTIYAGVLPNLLWVFIKKRNIKYLKINMKVLKKTVWLLNVCRTGWNRFAYIYEGNITQRLCSWPKNLLLCINGSWKMQKHVWKLQNTSAGLGKCSTHALLMTISPRLFT